MITRVLTAAAIGGILIGAAPALADATGPDPAAIVEGLAPVTGLEGVSEARAVDLAVGFATGSAELTPGGRAQLDSLAAALADPRLEGLTFDVIGHTDARGAADLNQRLSEARARAVADYLSRRHGIDPARLRVSGEGETRPKNPFDASAAENRRVEIRAYLPPEPMDGESGAGGAITE